MKSIIKLILTLIFSISLLACVMLTTNGKSVRVTRNPEAVKNCKFLNYVQGADDHFGGLVGKFAAEKLAMRKIRNNTGTMGANTVYITNITTDTNGSFIRGEAYFCEEMFSNHRTK